MLLSPTTSLGRYQILSRLGAGGMGEVYLAHDAQLTRNVAIKILPAELASDSERMPRSLLVDVNGIVWAPAESRNFAGNLPGNEPIISTKMYWEKRTWIAAKFRINRGASTIRALEHAIPKIGPRPRGKK